MSKTRRLEDEYQFPGFRPLAQVQGIYGDPYARVIRLIRRQKKQAAASAEPFTKASTIGRLVVFAICPVATRGFIWRWRFDGFSAGSARP